MGEKAWTDGLEAGEGTVCTTHIGHMKNESTWVMKTVLTEVKDGVGPSHDKRRERSEVGHASTSLNHA